MTCSIPEPDAAGRGIVLGTLDVRAVAAEVGPARHWLAKLLADEHVAGADDIVLMAGEVITKAICHSESGQGDGAGSVGVTVLGAGRTVRVEVLDAGSPDSAPRLTDQGLQAVSGRGLHLLEILSGRWGSYEDGRGRTVWFEVQG